VAIRHLSVSTIKNRLRKRANIWDGNAAFPPAGAGYAAGGFIAPRVSTVDKFAFLDDSRTTLGTGLSGDRSGAAGFASSSAGYAAGGFESAAVSTVDKFAFSNDSRTTLGTGLSSTRSGVAGFANK
jgi:hypothetical protein